MTRDELQAAVLREIGRVAPDASLAGLDPKADMREALDLDSMDIVNLVIALHDRLGVEVPDADVGRLVTLSGAVDYLAARLGIQQDS